MQPADFSSHASTTRRSASTCPSAVPRTTPPPLTGVMCRRRGDLAIVRGQLFFSTLPGLAGSIERPGLPLVEPGAVHEARSGNGLSGQELVRRSAECRYRQLAAQDHASWPCKTAGLPPISSRFRPFERSPANTGQLECPPGLGPTRFCLQSRQFLVRTKLEFRHFSGTEVAHPDLSAAIHRDRL